MATAWPTLTRAEFDPDKAVRTGRVLGLVSRDEVLRQQPFSIYFPNATTSSATAVKLKSITLVNYDAVVGCKLMLNFSCYVSNASAVGSWYAVVGTSTSSPVSVTNTSAARSGPPSPNAVVFPALVNAMAVPEQVTLELWASCTGGYTLNIAGAHDQWCWVED